VPGRAIAAGRPSAATNEARSAGVAARFVQATAITVVVVDVVVDEV